MKEITEFKESKTLKILYSSPQTAPTDDVWMINGLNCLRRYQRSLVNPEKEELSQRKLVEAGQESSDGNVSIFVVFC